MKVIYGNVWLAGDPSAEARSRESETRNLRPSPDFLVDWAQGLRAASQLPLDGYNDTVTLEFDVMRQFETVEAAEEFFLTHYLDVRAQRQASDPRIGKACVLILESGRELYIERALVKVRPNAAIGLTLDLHYTVLGGAIRGGDLAGPPGQQP